MVHSGNPENTGPGDTLNFIRAKNITVDKLFIPRSPDSDGSVIYCYKPPGQIKDGLISASIFEFVNDTSAIYNLMDEDHKAGVRETGIPSDYQGQKTCA